MFSLLCFSFYSQVADVAVLESADEELGFDFEETSSDKDEFSVNIGGAVFTGISLFF